MDFNSEIFIDANVLLEIILGRPNERKARNFLRSSNKTYNISALTAHLVVYFGIARVGFPILKQFLSDYNILPLSSDDIAWAFVNVRNNDFEDSLQLSVAVKHGCSTFVTFDKQLYNTYNELPTIHIKLLK
jgi:predicted nucleic acid-binding protein